MNGADGKRLGGDEASFDHIPNGIPGHRDPAAAPVFAKACSAGASTLNRFVELTSTNPAQGSTACTREGHHRGRQRCRPRGLGRSAGAEPISNADAPPRGRLHALRRHDAARLARRHPLARACGLAGRRVLLPRPARAASSPACGRAHRTTATRWTSGCEDRRPRDAGLISFSPLLVETVSSRMPSLPSPAHPATITIAPLEVRSASLAEQAYDGCAR